jgi:hypothetical protein
MRNCRHWLCISATILVGFYNASVVGEEGVTRDKIGAVSLSFGSAKNQGSGKVYFTILQPDDSFKSISKLVKIAG